MHWGTDKKELTLVMFLAFFLNFTPPTILTNKFIITDYLGHIEGEFRRKVYSVDFDMNLVGAAALNKILKELVDNKSTINNLPPEVISSLRSLIETQVIKESELGDEITRLFNKLI